MRTALLIGVVLYAAAVTTGVLPLAAAVSVGVTFWRQR